MSKDDNQSKEESEMYGAIESGWEFYRREGGRHSEPMAEWVVGLKQIDERQHEGFHKFDKAHLVMLTEEGLIPEDAAIQMFEAFREMEAHGVTEVRERDGHQGHSGEAYLIEKLGEDVGGYLHLGRSSNDLRPVSQRIMIRKYLLDLMEATLALMEAYSDTAEEYADAVMPTYTVLQHAQVGTFGWHLMSWERGIERSFDRLIEAYHRVNQSPAGMAAETTTDFPINRERTAELLGFDGLLDNGKDATRTDYDTYLEVINVLALLRASLSIAAQRILLWNMTEVDWVDVPDRYMGTSSIMPQKRNPNAVSSVLSCLDSTVGELMQSFMEAKNITGSPTIDAGLFEDTITLLDHWTEIVSNVEFDRKQAREQVYLDWAFATDIAGAMVRKCDLPWRTAHQITSILVRQAEEENLDVREISSEDVDKASVAYIGSPIYLGDDTLEEIIDPERALDARSEIAGSPAPKQVLDQIAQTRQAIRDNQETVATLQGALEESDQNLNAAIENLIT